MRGDVLGRYVGSFPGYRQLHVTGSCDSRSSPSFTAA